MSLSQTLLKYPEDLSGLSPFNLVQDERVIIPRTRSRHFAPQYGPFFTNSVSIRTIPGNVPLVLNQDYRVLLPQQDAAHDSGQSVCWIIALINPEIYGELAFDYQTIGGNYSVSTAAITALIANLEIDSRSVQYDDLIDKPITFPPSPHMHVVGDLYGWEDMVEIGQEIATVIATGQDDKFDAVNARINSILDQLTVINQTADALQQQIVANDGDIFTIQGRLTAIESAATALMAQVQQIQVNSSYVDMSGNSPLLLGGMYNLTSDATYQIQDLESLTASNKPPKKGDYFDFITGPNLTPVITVFNIQIQRLSFRGATDTHVRCLTAKRGRVVYQGSGLFEVFV